MTGISKFILLVPTLMLAASLTACGSEGDSQLSTRTLEFTEQQNEDFGFSDNPPQAKLGPEGPDEFSAGDAVSFSGQLVDDSRGDVGELDVSCTITRPGRFDQSHQQCTGTATLGDGTLVLSRGGLVFGAEEAVGAVIGGTGAYAGATGDFTEAEEGEGLTRYSLDLQIPEEN